MSCASCPPSRCWRQASGGSGGQVKEGERAIKSSLPPHLNAPTASGELVLEEVQEENNNNDDDDKQGPCKSSDLSAGGHSRARKSFRSRQVATPKVDDKRQVPEGLTSVMMRQNPVKCHLLLLPLARVHLMKDLSISSLNTVLESECVCPARHFSASNFKAPKLDRRTSALEIRWPLDSHLLSSAAFVNLDTHSGLACHLCIQRKIQVLADDEVVATHKRH